MNDQQESATKSQPAKHEDLQKITGQKSLTSMSSYESDSGVINRMPNMTTQYEQTHFLKKSDDDDDTSLRSTPAGEALLTGESPLEQNGLKNNQSMDRSYPHRCEEISLLNKEVNSKEPEDNGYGNDEIDAVPTRSERKLSKDSQIPNKITPQVTPSESSNPSHVEDNQDNLCCQTFFALFEWKKILEKFSAVDIFFASVSVGFYIFDIVTDILNAYSYYDKQSENKDNLLYFWLTAVLIVVPSIISQAFSLWWEAEDETLIRKQRQEQGRNQGHSFCYWFLIAQMHIFQIAPLFRYLRATYFGLKSRIEEQKKNTHKEIFYDNKWKYEYCDVSFLRLFESFLESAPQLVLQIYIMVTTRQTPFITVMSCLGSWGGLSMAFLSFQRALRNSRKDKKQISIVGSIFLVLYRSCTILSRVFALALLLNVHIWAWLGLFIVHWGLMTGWIILQGTNFCQSKVKEIVYDIVIGFCYNFAYLNVTGKRSNKYRMTVFYIVMLIENCVCAGIWMKYRHGGGSLIDALMGSSLVKYGEEFLTQDVALTIVVLIPSSFILGILFMLLYYTFFHPTTGDLPCCKEGQETTKEESEVETAPNNSCVEMRTHSVRTYRKSETFRSWPSGSVNLDETSGQARPARPKSEVIESSASSLFDEPKPAQTVATTQPVEVNSSYSSCYSLRHDDVTTFNRGTTGQAIVAYSTQIRDSGETTVYPQKGVVTHTQENEVKRLKVELLIQEKKRQKRELEKTLMQLSLKPHSSPQATKSPQSPTEELFNRKERAKLLAVTEPSSSYSRPSSRQSLLSSPVAVPMSDRPMSSVTERPVKKPLPPSPLTHSSNETKLSFTNQPSACHSSPSSRTLAFHRKRLNSEETNLQSTSMFNMGAMPAKCGTFPRCSRRQDLSTPSRSAQSSTLKTIRENKLTMHSSGGSRDYSASLSNIAIKQQLGGSLKKTKVPRAMSFTVSKNEQVISIESTL